jgi:NADH:ubiquinone oxidoreductase subunit 2 (subunit N)
MYMQEREEGRDSAAAIRSWQISAAVILSVLLVLALGLYPSPVLSLFIG